MRIIIVSILLAYQLFAISIQTGQDYLINCKNSYANNINSDACYATLYSSLLSIIDYNHRFNTPRADMPNNLSFTQIHLIVVNFIEKNPKRINENAPGLILDSLIDSYGVEKQ